MASNVITTLRTRLAKSGGRLLYYFCDYKDPKSQASRKVIQSLLAAMCHQDASTLETMASISKRYREFNSASSTSEVFDMMLTCLTTWGHTFLIVDALDECNDRQELIAMLRRTASKLPHVSLLITSREEQDIKMLLQTVPSLSLDPKDMAQDIEIFVKNELRRLVDTGKLRIRQSSLEDRIAGTLISKADGMYVTHVPGGVELELSCH